MARARVSPRRRGAAAAPARVALIACLLPYLARGQPASLTGMSSSSILVVRSSSPTTAAVVDEYNSNHAQQTAAIQSVPLSNCLVISAASGGPFGGVSADGTYALFTCGTTTTSTRPIIRIDSGGNIDSTQFYNDLSSIYTARGIASMEGTNLFEGDGEGGREQFAWLTRTHSVAYRHRMCTTTTC